MEIINKIDVVVFVNGSNRRRFAKSRSDHQFNKAYIEVREQGYNNPIQVKEETLNQITSIVDEVLGDSPAVPATLAELDQLFEDRAFFGKAPGQGATDAPIITYPDPLGTTVIIATQGTERTQQFEALNVALAWQLTTTPNEPQISISNTGLLTISANTPADIYNCTVIASNSIGQSTPVNFIINVQSGIIGGMRANYDAFTENGQPNGGAITRWNDSSGNNFALRQQTALNRPIIVKDILGPNNHVIRFNGSNTRMPSIANFINIIPTILVYMEIWIVVRRNAVVSQPQTVISFPRNTNANNNNSFQEIGFDVNYSTNGGLSPNTNYIGYRGRQSIGAAYSVASKDNEVDGNFNIWRFKHGGGVIQCYKNGELIDSETYSSPSFESGDGNRPFTVGYTPYQDNRHANIDVAHILIYSFEFTNEQTNQQWTALGDRYGIPVTLIP